MENATRRIGHLCHRDRAAWERAGILTGARAEDWARVPVEALEEEPGEGEEDGPNPISNSKKLFLKTKEVPK